eukprot:COSAG06_NODE_4312_length_4371_cov_63.064139_2_plen_254_part_00
MGQTARNLNIGVSRNRFCDFLADADSRSFSRFGAIIMQFAVCVCCKHVGFVVFNAAPHCISIIHTSILPLPPPPTLLRDVGPCGPPPRPAPRPSPPAYRQQQHHRRHCILGRKGGSAVRAERLRRDAWCAWDSRRWRPGRRRPCEQPVRCDPRTRPVCLPVSLSRGGLIIHPHPSPAALQLALPGWQCQPVLQWLCYAAAYRHRSPRTRVYLHCYISIDISLSLSLCLAGRAIYFCEYDGECIRRVGMDGVIR